MADEPLAITPPPGTVLAVQAVRSMGGCATVSDDGQTICIKRHGHAGEHGDTRQLRTHRPTGPRRMADMADWHVLPEDGYPGTDFDAYPPDEELVWVHEVYYAEGEASIGYCTTYSSGRRGWRLFTGSDDVGIRAWAPMEKPDVP